MEISHSGPGFLSRPIQLIPLCPRLFLPSPKSQNPGQEARHSENEHSHIPLLSLIRGQHQQQRIYQIPNPIKSTARINHQKAEGKTRDRMMISPAEIATKPSMQCRPLRIENRLPRRKLSSVYAGDGLLIRLYIPRICAGRSIHTGVCRSGSGFRRSHRYLQRRAPRSPAPSDGRSRESGTGRETDRTQ